MQQHNSSLPLIWSDTISLSASWLFPLFFFGLYARKFPPPSLIQQTLLLGKYLLPCLIWEGDRCQLDTCDNEAGSFSITGKCGWCFAQLCHILWFCKLLQGPACVSPMSHYRGFICDYAQCNGHLNRHFAADGGLGTAKIVVNFLSLFYYSFLVISLRGFFL